MIVGNGVPGKSTLADGLAQRTGLPVVHLDALYWQPGWREPSSEHWRLVQRRALAGDDWIADGNYVGTAEERLPRADLVILLDYSRLTCLLGVVRRRWRFRHRRRPDMAPDCPERLTADFLRYVWSYRRKHLPRVLAQVADHHKSEALVRLRSRRQAETWLSQLDLPGQGR
jgi:adenylate kinase family enzyme